MEKLKKKHDHKMTKCLKVLIFAIVMLAPFFAILTECLYVVNNESSVSNYTGTLQNVFYNAVNQLGTQPIFNWTTSTAIYTTINAMTTGLEMGTGSNTLAILLTYWTLNTAIYIVMDIIIELFTKLTHFISGE